MNEGASLDRALSQWLTGRCLNKRPKTVELYGDVARLIRRHWPGPLEIAVDTITAEQVLELGQRLAHQCATRWNLIVAALRFFSPHGKLLRRKPCRVREFTPPTQAQFAALLAECDRARGSRAGLIVRFLCFTGLRIGEARGLTWADVTPDCIYVPARLSKNGRGRSVPMVPGLAEVLERLRVCQKGVGLTYILPRQNCRKALESASRRACGVAWSAHLCRHFFATRCIQSGVDLPTVARWLGHKDGGGLLARTYFHLADGHSRDMAARVQIQGQTVSGNPGESALADAEACEFI